MEWYVGRMEEKRNTYTILVGKSGGRKSWEDLLIDEKMI